MSRQAASHSPTFSPLYRQIRGLITRSLESGEWGPGDLIPSESELAVRFGVSQGTVRKAIDEMAAENLLVRRQGKGTFVASHNDPRSFFRFLRIGANEGELKPLKSIPIECWRAKAGSDVARTLALEPGEKLFPILPVVDHYAGSEKLMNKAIQLQNDLGPVFDVTCDCEDGAHAGAEREHAEMAAHVIMSDANRFGRVGARIHDITHPNWQQDLDILVSIAGTRLPFITFPKPRSAADVRAQVSALRDAEARTGLKQQIPVHVLIETFGALREAWEIAALPSVESLDFGLMDFVSGHHGAVPGSAMKSPGQFEHPLVVRAKCEISTAALANGVVPTHNVTTELKDIEVIRNDARRARVEFGYLRMWSIHPNQIMPIVEAMRPDFSEVEVATEILVAAQDTDWGPIAHDGRLHDRASYRYYWELLARAKATGMTLPANAAERFFG